MRLSPSLVNLPAGSRYLPGRARHRWASRHQHHGDVDRRGGLGRPFRRTRHRRWTCACSSGRRLARNPRLHRPPPLPRSRARRWPKATEARATRPEPDLLARRNWIAYDATTPEPHDNPRKPKLFIADRSGRKLHRAVSLENSQYWEAAGFDAIAWSPDSRHGAYVRSEPDPEMQEPRRGLFVTDIQTGERELPLHVEGTTPAADEQRRWGLYDPVAYSPDGRTLVVAG